MEVTLTIGSLGCAGVLNKLRDLLQRRGVGGRINAEGEVVPIDLNGEVVPGERVEGYRVDDLGEQAFDETRLWRDENRCSH